MKKLIINIVLLLAGIQGFSQDSLMHYLTIAVRENPTVIQKYHEYEAALQKLPQVGSLPDPELSAGIFLSPMEVMNGKQVAEFKLMQMFPWFGVLKNAKDEMSLMAKAKYETFRDAKLQVLFEVEKTWYELLKNKQEIGLNERNLNILQTIEQIALVKFKTSSGSTNSPPEPSSSRGTVQANSNSSLMSGMGNSSKAVSKTANTMQSGSMGTMPAGSGLSDLYRIKIEMYSLENNIALLKDQQTTIRTRFNNLLNRSRSEPVVLPDTIIQVSGLFPLDSTFMNNPMLEMLKYENQSIEARNKMVNRMGYPMVGLGLNYSLINKKEMSTSPMNGDDMIMPMVTVTLPIYRKKYMAMKLETKFLQSANEQNVSATRNTLETEYYAALESFHDASRRTDLYRNQSDLAQKSLNIMIAGYSASNTSLTDILRVHQQLTDYEIKQIEAVADYNISAARLNRISANTSIQ